MKCAICDIETNGNDVRWGPEFAHELCVEILRMGVDVGKNLAAEICEKRAKKCESMAEICDDQDDVTELRARAWQFYLLAEEIKKN